MAMAAGTVMVIGLIIKYGKSKGWLKTTKWKNKKKTDQENWEELKAQEVSKVDQPEVIESDKEHKKEN